VCEAENPSSRNTGAVKADEVENRVELDRVRRHPCLPVLEVDSGDNNADDYGGSAQSEYLA
jgi:hypothetical protein